MDDFLNRLQTAGFAGEIDTSAETLETYSHDASLFEIRPEVVVSPLDAPDVETLVKTVAKLKRVYPKLSITGRSAGTDMAGGAINDSIIASFTPHMNAIGTITKTTGTAQPGVYYRDFEARTLARGGLMPSYPASRDLAAIGGIVNNNSGGEKSLEYGKTADWVKQLKVVFADGVERVVKPLKRDQLDAKMAQKDFEGEVYRGIYKLCEDNYDLIKAAKPHVSKNSMGYGIWDVWDRETGLFDLTRLIVGSEGTLGMLTEVTFKLTPKRKHSGLLVLFLRDVEDLGELIPEVLKSKPATFEGFDQATLVLTIRFMPYFLKMLGWKKFIHLLLSLIPDGVQLLHGVPKMILMVEFNGDTEEEVRQKIRTLHNNLAMYHARYEINGFEEDATEGKSEKFWIMRRYAFQVLRKKVRDKHTAPFIDDFIVPPATLPVFLPKLRKIIKKYKLFATIQGHIGDGNFHVIPLMEIEKITERRKLLPAMKEVNHLVLKYGGSLSGEHNDGLVRGPWLKEQFGPKMLQVFKDAKHVMDPQNIFNPRKKADADWDYSYAHIRQKF